MVTKIFKIVNSYINDILISKYKFTLLFKILLILRYLCSKYTCNNVLKYIFFFLYNNYLLIYFQIWVNFVMIKKSFCIRECWSKLNNLIRMNIFFFFYDQILYKKKYFFCIYNIIVNCYLSNINVWISRFYHKERSTRKSSTVYCVG